MEVGSGCLYARKASLCFHPSPPLAACPEFTRVECWVWAFIPDICCESAHSQLDSVLEYALVWDAIDGTRLLDQRIHVGGGQTWADGSKPELDSGRAGFGAAWPGWPLIARESIALEKQKDG